MCVDWNKVKLQANEFASNYAVMDVMLVPCGVKVTFQGAKDDRISENCNFDQQKLIEYMNPSTMLIWRNIGRFKTEEFGAESV